MAEAHVRIVILIILNLAEICTDNEVVPILVNYHAHSAADQTYDAITEIVYGCVLVASHVFALVCYTR